MKKYGYCFIACIDFNKAILKTSKVRFVVLSCSQIIPVLKPSLSRGWSYFLSEGLELTVHIFPLQPYVCLFT